MTAPTLWIIAGLYAVQMVIELIRGNAPGATILAGYIIANAGLIWSLRA